MLSKEECRILARFRQPITNAASAGWPEQEVAIGMNLYGRELLMFDHRISAFVITKKGEAELIASLAFHVENKAINQLRHQLDDDRRCTVWGSW